MKKLLFIVILLTAGLSGLRAQEIKADTSSPDYHFYRDFTLSVSPNLVVNTPNGTQFAGGFKIRMFVGKHFSFDSEFLAARDYIQFAPGLAGIPMWLLFLNGGQDSGDFTLSDLAAIAALTVMSTEHFAYHIPLNNSVELSPYISLLRFESTYRRGTIPDPDPNAFQAAFAVGAEVNKYFKRFMLSPYIEYNRAYSTGTPGFNTGVYFGYYFYSRR